MPKDFKYADLLDDDVFKLVFGRESSKEAMIGLLNLVIDDRTIIDLDFMDKEMKTLDRDRKNSIYDMFCRTDDGSRIIVEVQRRKQPFYPERSLYYSTFQIQDQINAGAENYEFLPVYIINILDFNLEINKGNSDVKTVYRLYERDGHRLMTDKLTFVFIELRKFSKSLNEIGENTLDGIYYCLKHMPSLIERPACFRQDIFKMIFEISELINMDSATRQKVIEKMTTERDLRNQMAWARKEAIEEGLAEGREKGLAEGREKGLAEGREKGLAEGRAEGRAEGACQVRTDVAEKLLLKGMSITDIAEVTGMTAEEIRCLQK